MFELQPENQLWVNPLIASEWDLKSGDYVRLGSPNGVVSNRIRVRVTERIGPDSVFMAHGFGHRSKRLRLTAGVGADDTTLMSNIKVDPIMGGTGMRANYVTFVKESGRVGRFLSSGIHVITRIATARISRDFPEGTLTSN